MYTDLPSTLSVWWAIILCVIFWLVRSSSWSKSAWTLGTDIVDELGAAICETFVRWRYTFCITTSRQSSFSSSFTLGTEPEIVKADDDAAAGISLNALSTDLAGLDSFSKVVNGREIIEESVVRTFGRHDDAFTLTGFSRESSAWYSVLAVPSIAKQLISICPLVVVRGWVKKLPPLRDVDVPNDTFGFSSVGMFESKISIVARAACSKGLVGAQSFVGGSVIGFENTLKSGKSHRFFSIGASNRRRNSSNLERRIFVGRLSDVRCWNAIKMSKWWEMIAWRGYDMKWMNDWIFEDATYVSASYPPFTFVWVRKLFHFVAESSSLSTHMQQWGVLKDLDIQNSSYR